MESISIGLAIQVGGYIVTAAILVLGLKFALNGLRGDMREIKADMKTLLESDAKQNERLVAVETEAESRKGWIRRIEDGLKELRGIIERRGESRQP